MCLLKGVISFRVFRYVLRITLCSLVYAVQSAGVDICYFVVFNDGQIKICILDHCLE